MRTIGEGDRILFVTQRGKRYLVSVKRGERFHTSEGYVDLDDVIGKRYGSKIKTNTGSVWTAFEPTILDHVLNFPRITQIIYPKDLGYIILVSGVRCGSRVVEGGTGSAVLTAILAYHVAPHGKVYSYDVNEEYLKNAEKRLESLGLRSFVELKHGDLTERIDERDVDAVILDIPTPWLAVKPSYEALKDSGIFVSISPTIEQVIETVDALKENGFADISTVEILLRNMRVKRGMTRPEHLMHAHTVYITTARKSVADSLDR